MIIIYYVHKNIYWYTIILLWLNMIWSLFIKCQIYWYPIIICHLKNAIKIIIIFPFYKIVFHYFVWIIKIIFRIQRIIMYNALCINTTYFFSITHQWIITCHNAPYHLSTLLFINKIFPLWNYSCITKSIFVGFFFLFFFSSESNIIYTSQILTLTTY